MSIFEQSKSGDALAMVETCTRAVVQETHDLLRLEDEGSASGRTRLRLAWTVADFEDAARALSFEELPSGAKDDLWMAGRVAHSLGKAARSPLEQREMSHQRMASAAGTLSESVEQIARAIHEDEQARRRGRLGAHDDDAELGEARRRRRWFGRSA